MRKALMLAVGGLLATSLVAASAPGATAATTSVVRSGRCSGTSTWKLTLTHDNGRIESDLEVQTHRAGQAWRSRFSDNGTIFARVTKTTGSDGSFSLTRYAANQAGPDTIRVRSTNLTTAEVCRARATI